MAFSILDLLFLAFGVTLIVICAKRGLILSLIKFFKMLLSVLAANLWGGLFGNFVGEKFLNTPIRNSVYKKVYAVYEETTGGFSAEQSMDAIPQFVLTDEMREKLNGLEETGEELVNSVTDTVSGAISSVVCGVIGFLLVFVAVFLALSLVYVLVKNMKKIFKTFGRADTVCGAILGFVFAWMVLLFAGSLFKFFCGSQPIYQDSTVAKFFGESSLHESLKFLDLNQWLHELFAPKI